MSGLLDRRRAKLLAAPALIFPRRVISYSGISFGGGRHWGRLRVEDRAGRVRDFDLHRLLEGWDGQVPTHAMLSGALGLWAAAGNGKAPAGQQVFLGNDTFAVPAGYTEISLVLVGGGGGGFQGASAPGGASGGDLRWHSALAVTGGESLDVEIGGGGTRGGTNGFGTTIAATKGGLSQILRSGSPLLIAAGGGEATYASAGAKNGTSSTLSGPIGGGDGGTGGAGSDSDGAGGGGGAGGYSGNGGSGQPSSGSGSGGGAGSGGGGGGGGTGRNSLAAGGGGGGVGLLGAGSNGSGGAEDAEFGAGGNGGSGGDAGVAGNENDGSTGGSYGGGAGSYDGNSLTTGGSPLRGGPGAGRIVWGTGRAYPTAANVADV